MNKDTCHVHGWGDSIMKLSGLPKESLNHTPRVKKEIL